MSEAKQTAMQDLIHWLKCGWMDKDIEAVIKKAQMLLEKEREQIKDAFIFSDTSNTSNEDAEQYYNQAYNKQDK
jgi:hypothetical protein